MNDIKKAIETLSDIDKCVRAKADGAYATNEFDEAAKIAISALEKQIPKRPHADDNGSVEYYESWLECPECGETIPEYTSENETDCYCVGCGQKLDWSVGDE